MTKRKGQKDKQHNGHFLLGIVLLVLLSLLFGHCVVCPSALFFGHFVACPSVPVRLTIVLLVLLFLCFGHCVACPSVPFLKEKARITSNTMTKRKGQKDKQHNGQKKMTEGEPTQWPKENDRRTNNTSVSCPSVPFFWSLCCLSFWHFLLAIVLLVLLPFSLAILLLVLLSLFV
jgi:hypothetical protein